MPRKILVRKAKENQMRVKILRHHFCECNGHLHKSLTALVTKPDKTFTLAVCENDKGACRQKKLSGIKIKSDGKHSMQYSQEFTLRNEIALVYL